MKQIASISTGKHELILGEVVATTIPIIQQFQWRVVVLLVILNWSWGAEICQSLFWVCLLKVFCLFVCFDEINSGISSLNIVDCTPYQEWLQSNQRECNSVFVLLVGSSSSCLTVSAGTKDQLFHTWSLSAFMMKLLCNSPEWVSCCLKT